MITALTEARTRWCDHLSLCVCVCVCVCRALPLFVWHRQNWNVVYPSLELEEGELATLAPLGTYVAGFTDASAEGRTDLYDLFVNGQCLLFPHPYLLTGMCYGAEIGTILL